MTGHVERLSSTSFFADAGSAAVERVAAAGIERQLTRGDVLFRLDPRPFKIAL